MHIEVAAAINLIAANLYNKLPRRRVDAFCEEVEKGIFIKIQGNWHPGNPSKGAAYRCIHVSGEKLDPLFIYAAINSGLDMEEVSSYLSKGFVIWINPGEVTFTMGENSQVKVLYKATPTSVASSTAALCENNVSTSLPQQPPVSLSTCPTAITSVSSDMSSPLSSPDELASTLSSSFGSLSLSSGGSGSNGTAALWGTTPSPVPWPSSSTANDPWSPMSTQKAAQFPWNTDSSYNAINMQAPSFQMGVPPASRPSNTNNKTMTAAMFAQTKFGSTKLKSHTKRSNRLSPTENFTRTMQGSTVMYPTNTCVRQTSTMHPAFIDRMQAHLNNNPVGEFAIDHFKMAGNPAVNKAVAPSRPSLGSSASSNPIGSSNGPADRYSPCNNNSALAGMFSAEHDWIDLSDMTLSSGGNPLLAA